jgi:hypothetical protein
MLTQAVGRHRHALIRDLLALGFRAADMFTDRLTISEVISIVVAAPPTSSLRFFIDGGWTRADHILANMAEQEAGLAGLTAPYERPGLGDRCPGQNIFPADAMTWEEMDARDAQRAAGPAGKTHKREWR